MAVTADGFAPPTARASLASRAGSTFEAILRSVYGDDAVEKDDADRPGDPRSPMNTARQASLQQVQETVLRRPAWPRVIAGHFWLGKYESLRSSAFVVSWLREPVARLASGYFYWRQAPSSGNPFHEQVHAGELPFEPFVELDWFQNGVSRRFLRGYDLEDLDFVGVQERIAADVEALRAKLGWPTVSIPALRVNDDPDYCSLEIPESLRHRIRELNAEDVEFYERALALSRRRSRSLA